MRFREMIANLLNRFPDTCWGTMAFWIYFPQVVGLRECLHQPCMEGHAFCGKCVWTGRIRDEGAEEAFIPQKYWRIGLKRLLGRDAE